MFKINILFMVLAVLAALALLVGCAGSGQQASVTRTEISQTTVEPTHDRKLTDLCSQVKASADQPGADQKSEVEEYTTHPAPGVSEYHRESHQSSRYSAAASDRDRMLELCAQIE